MVCVSTSTGYKTFDTRIEAAWTMQFGPYALNISPHSIVMCDRSLEKI